MARRRNLMNRPGFPPGRRLGSLPGRRPGTFGGTGNVGRPDKRPKTKVIRRPVSPSAGGPRPGRIKRPASNIGGPRPGRVNRPSMGNSGQRPAITPRPTVKYPTLDFSKMNIGRIDPKELALQGRLFSEGGEVNMKTPIDQLPNEGLKKLAKSKKGREAVAKMGFKEGGIAKGGKCPHRGNVRGTGAAVRGVKFVGTR